MNLVVMEGFRAEIFERTGRTLDEVRPMRRMVEGLPVARERAVSAPKGTGTRTGDED